MNNEIVEIYGQYQHHTTAALCLDIDEEIHWFPFSLLTEISGNYNKGEEMVITIPFWLAEDKELI